MLDIIFHAPYYIAIIDMGEQQSKPRLEDYFLLEQLTKMALSNRKKVSYYFIHPHKGTYILQWLEQLRPYFKIDHFLQIKTMKQEMSLVGKNEVVKTIVCDDLAAQDLEYLIAEGKVNQIIIVCRSDGFLPHSKRIVRFGQDFWKDSIGVLSRLEERDSLNLPSSNLLMVDQDTKLLNKYRLNYHCNTKFQGRYQAKQDFVTLARYLLPKYAQSIDDFQKNYDLQLQAEDRTKMVLDWAFKTSFYWDLVNEITRNTTDPKKIAYMRLALKDLFEAIQSDYKQRWSKKYPWLYIVMDITEEELAKLANSQGKNLLFTSFVKGFTSQREAILEMKNRLNAFKFRIASNRSKLEPSVDFGFVIGEGCNPNVIFNIYNVFKVKQIIGNKRQGDLLYGALAMGYIRRQELDRHLLSNVELDLLRNFDYLEDMMMKIDSQATLLQLSGYYQESLQVYDKKVDFIRKSNESQQSINKCIIHKADALRRSGEFDNAEREYQSGEFRSEKMKLISQIHLAELYMHRGEDAKFDKIIEEITPKIEGLIVEEKEEYFKARNFVIIRTIKRGAFQKAEKMLNDLKQEVTTAFPKSLEGKPLVHDLYRSIATVKSKLGKHSEALSLLKDTLSWQLVCQGKTANVALTETLIQQVSRSWGNTDQLQQSLSRLRAMSLEMQSAQTRFESVIGVDLNKSLVSISMQ